MSNKVQKFGDDSDEPNKQIIEKLGLRSHLQFDSDSGHIWLGESRMLLLHAAAMGTLRKELFETLGAEKAAGVLWRMGFVCGQSDADIALQHKGESDNYDIFRIGPEMHSLEGIVNARMTSAEIDWEEGMFFGSVEWTDSWEAKSHIEHFGHEDKTACWSLVGYASGYVTRFFKRYVLFREVQCACAGHAACRIVGKPVESWSDDDARELDFLRAQPSDDSSFELEEDLRALREQIRQQSQVPEQTQSDELVGISPGFKDSFGLLCKAAKSPINVLLLGETGVGKEVFARWLHGHSDRKNAPFVTVNCAAIPADLIDSELFGISQVDASGEAQTRPGRFERADGGSLFLDEVAELSLSAQAKILRVLQTKELEGLGDRPPKKINVRIIAATNADLHKAMKDGRFRSDLFYRLATYPVEIPPLRDRKMDIPPLVEKIVEKFTPIYDKRVAGLTDKALNALNMHNWPGNVRELENVIERAMLLVPPGGKIEVHHLFPHADLSSFTASVLDEEGGLSAANTARNLYDALLQEGFDLNDHESKILNLAVQKADGNLASAARMLNITRRQLAYRIKSRKDIDSDQ